MCLERGADLHIAQLMPLPLTVSCFSKIQIGFAFLVPAHPGSPGKGPVNRVCVFAVLSLCVCVCVCVGVADQLQTNYASDLRHMLKSVFDSYTSDVVARLDAADNSSSGSLDARTDSTHRTVATSDSSPTGNHHYHHSATSVIGTQWCRVIGVCRWLNTDSGRYV